MKIKNTYKVFAYSLCAVLMPVLAGCEEGKSYSDMLDDERDAVNWYLAQQQVVAEVPEDSVFISGKDAPFYRLKADGSVYMRVINPGEEDNRASLGLTVYFRYTSYDLLTMYDTKNMDLEGSGNSATITNGSASFVFGNTVLSTTTSWGTGIQEPMKYLGYNCEVDLIVKSTEGPAEYIATCNPILYKGLKYFKAEY